MYLVNEESLLEQHKKQKRRKAAGIDGVVKDEYDVNHEGRIHDLIQRMKQLQYRPQPVRRVYIPKTNGKTRPVVVKHFCNTCG